ncbi:MAG TPA: glyceraldehyde-3-phosphate dehydrogenase [Candidatus Cloacimonas sp.]|nr:glyceraldehyde-3-phosphate dehydrogenase [Candidatus Cloacimonas sp.]
MDFTGKKMLGINGLGRIGKLTLWNQLALKHFDGFVVNVGREVGKDFSAVIQAIATDSTYGKLGKFLYGMYPEKFKLKVLNEQERLLELDGMPVKILQKARNPREIAWSENGVRLVIDCTGKFRDPVVAAEEPRGSIRGHLNAGAEKVLVSAPFKIKDPTKTTPEDSTMLVYGVNHLNYDPEKHHIISAASCTTTGLAHMMKPLLEDERTADILTASMSTIHAATGSQSILDSMPKAGSKDLRKNRSVLNNIILTSTGAAKALEKIIPQIQEIGFMADSVRIPTNTVSLITLNITFHTEIDDKGNPYINRKYINDIYKKAAAGPQKDLLIFSEEQNVSAVLIGYKAAAVIEGHETHTRTGFMHITPKTLQSCGIDKDKNLRIPVTHAKIFGWYDNEFGSYVNSLSRLAIYVDEQM